MSQEVYYWYDSPNLVLHLSNTKINNDYDILYFGESYDAYKRAERAVVEGDKLILPESARYMFFDCNRLQQIDISKIDVSNVKDMSYMFATCGATYLDLSMWDVSNAEDMSGLFAHAQYLKSLNISSWNMNKVKSISSMFTSCYLLTTIKVSQDTDWNTLPNIESYMYLFNGCTKLLNYDGTTDISKAYTGKDGKGYFTFKDLSAYVYKNYHWHQGVIYNNSNDDTWRSPQVYIREDNNWKS